MSESTTSSPALSMKIAVPMNRLRSRLRREQGPATGALAMSQLSVLGMLADLGQGAANRLTRAEHVRGLSFAETLLALKLRGFVGAAPDPADGRNTLRSPVTEGQWVVALLVDRCGARLANIIDPYVTEEQKVFEVVADIVTRIAGQDQQLLTTAWRG